MEKCERLNVEAETALFKARGAFVDAELRQLERRERDALASDEYARIYPFYGTVGSSTVERCIRELGTWSRRDPGQPIRLVLTSPGGNVIDGFALFDFIQELRASGHHIETVALGWAASMGGILLQAGDKRIMGRSSWMLIHEISSANVGKTSEMEDELKFVKRLQERALDILAERATFTKRQIANRWKRKDWWLDAPEALRLGFVDEVR